MQKLFFGFGLSVVRARSCLARSVDVSMTDDDMYVCSSLLSHTKWKRRKHARPLLKRRTIFEPILCVDIDAKAYDSSIMLDSSTVDL